MNTLHPISNVTARADMGGQMTRQTFIHSSIVYGLSLEVAVHGLITVLLRLSASNIRDAKKFKLLGIILVIGNVSAIGYILSVVYRGNFTESNCVVLSFLGNLFSHVFYMSFDVMILYKCYHLTNRNKYALYCIFLILINRTGWMVADLRQTYGLWIPDFSFCGYIQDPITGPGSNFSDIISDCFATLTALVLTLLRYSLSSKYIQVMVIRTIMRSIFVVAVNILVVIMNVNPPNAFWHYFAWNLRVYVLLRMLNLDILLDFASDKRASEDSSPKVSNDSGQRLSVPKTHGEKQPFIVSEISASFNNRTLIRKESRQQ
ncbi:hypothetical protein BCR33DRAFT_850199 [Rhizoclosmatium globosum]|uniref:G-protein coupled receptors family 1 profile domain-containing protein n=1 Tax=Rhizoclosmatium globosum TaxID=329046 RepID=A0A1Y2CEK6_9FUNG|nr:hypothetical protein BCR33DRAFT_850199 [Rhizoclosmatium globosum]|eukprot:ORY45366.1 hypothetical protein BCR33DRAFT_850199 [Rhizoclosmatium globosum]